MRHVAYFRSLLSSLFCPSAVDVEMEEEVRSHIQHRADDLERNGMSRATAERQAQIELGGCGRYKEECRESLAGHFFVTLVQDFRFGLRVLRKSPNFTAVAVLTLAVGIGANAVVFSAPNSLILRPLNLPGAENLYMIEQGREKSPMQSYPDYLDLRDHSKTFGSIAAYAITRASINTGGHATVAWLYEASGNYFDVLGVQPYRGRFFHCADEHGPGSAPYVVLRYAFWRARFLADPGVVGRRVQLNKNPSIVLGVAPPGFRGTELYFTPDFWVPLVNDSQVGGGNDLKARAARAFLLVGRLKPGVATAQAATDLNSVAGYLTNSYPKTDEKMSFALARPGLMGDMLGGPAARVHCVSGHARRPLSLMWRVGSDGPHRVACHLDSSTGRAPGRSCEVAS